MPVAYEMSGRVAVVTGASKGIGRTIAGRLAAAGARVWNWDAAPTDAGTIRSAPVDVTDPAAIAAALDRVLAEDGRVDILVNNAGMTGPSTAIVDTDSGGWRRIIDVNLTGVFEVCRAVVPSMRESGWGRVVNIASLAGKEGSPRLGAYSAAKAGVIALTKSLGKELAGSGVLVNAVAPAAIETDILQQMSPDFVAGMIAKSPMNRLGTVDEVAELVLWLASDACSFSTGAVFDLSGGRATY